MDMSDLHSPMSASLGPRELSSDSRSDPHSAMHIPSTSAQEVMADSSLEPGRPPISQGPPVDFCSASLQHNPMSANVKPLSFPGASNSSNANLHPDSRPPLRLEGISGVSTEASNSGVQHSDARVTVENDQHRNPISADGTSIEILQSVGSTANDPQSSQRSHSSVDKLHHDKSPNDPPTISMQQERCDTQTSTTSDESHSEPITRGGGKQTDSLKGENDRTTQARRALEALQAHPQVSDKLYRQFQRFVRKDITSKANTTARNPASSNSAKQLGSASSRVQEIDNREELADEEEDDEDDDEETEESDASMEMEEDN